MVGYANRYVRKGILVLVRRQHGKAFGNREVDVDLVRDVRHHSEVDDPLRAGRGTGGDLVGTRVRKSDGCERLVERHRSAPGVDQVKTDLLRILISFAL